MTLHYPALRGMSHVIHRAEPPGQYTTSLQIPRHRRRIMTEGVAVVRRSQESIAVASLRDKVCRVGEKLVPKANLAKVWTSLR